MTNLNIKSVASISNIVAVEAPATDSPEKHINSVLAGFNYSIDDLVPQATQFLIYKLFCMCESADPMTSLKGLELMGKTAYCGLFRDKIEVSYSHKSSEELQQELQALTTKLGLVGAL
jgi:hypothetical protein